MRRSAIAALALACTAGALLGALGGASPAHAADAITVVVNSKAGMQVAGPTLAAARADCPGYRLEVADAPFDTGTAVSIKSASGRTLGSGRLAWRASARSVDRHQTEPMIYGAADSGRFVVFCQLVAKIPVSPSASLKIRIGDLNLKAMTRARVRAAGDRVELTQVCGQDRQGMRLVLEDADAAESYGCGWALVRP